MASETNSGDTSPGNPQTHGQTGELGQQQPDHLEIDEIDEIDNWDGDSALGGMSQFSSTQSVTSSIYDHVVENGRTYHRFKEGKYLLPNDEREQKRLDFQHQLYTSLLNGKLFLSPVGDRLRNVLDVGTGTGIWAIEVGVDYPGAHITGIDLSPIQPIYAPPNVTFEICDAEDEWSFRQPFDFIHMREMVTCFKNPRRILAEAYRSLEPGGYIELCDPILPFQFLTPPPEGCALRDWCDMLMEAARRVGRDWGVATRYAQMLSDIGFINVTERREAIALSPWVKGAHNKQLSMLLQHDVLNMLEAVCMALFTRVLGWDAQRVLDCLELVKRDVQNTKIHAYSEGVHIYAQKPYNSQSSSSH
ncbi:S-adenosyl-L-methionine-dependent methyltransferase [Nemania sp. FL0031]|nr:S-adenosyl-L-methionine-dependent methyltransferase [Nemania sp. FL0031]